MPGPDEGAPSPSARGRGSTVTTGRLRGIGRQRTLHLVVAVLVVAALATVPATGGAADAADGPAICEREADALVATYNENINDVPGLVRGRVSNTVVHGVVNGPAGGDYTFETDSKGRVESYSEGKPGDATMRVVTDCESFRSMTDTEDTVDAFWREYRSDDVNFVGVGPVRGLIVDGIEVVVSLGDTLNGVLPLGFYESTAIAGGVLLLIALAVLLLIVYVVYRRLTMIRMRRRRRREA